jgi:hypothetical protein
LVTDDHQGGKGAKEMEASDYFEIVSAEDSVFHFRVKGFWTDEVLAHIGTQFLDRIEQGVDSMEGEKFLLLVDTTEFKPPSQKVREVMTHVMMYARERNLYKTVEVMPSAITRIAVQQAAKESGKDDFRIVVSSLEEAWERINELKQEL